MVLMEDEVVTPHMAVRASKKKRLTIIFGVATMLLLVAAVVTGVVIARKQYVAKHPLSRTIQSQANFPLYYPSPLPTDYAYRKGSARIDGGIVFYTLENKGKSITISEQAAPQNPPDLSRLPGFSSLQTIAGKALIGKNLGKPTVIIVGITSLITITGSPGIPSDVIANTAKAMVSLP
jgi:hypothetical protein